jgi:Lipid A 3-O-deacylase (PagL)
MKPVLGIELGLHRKSPMVAGALTLQCGLCQNPSQSVWRLWVHLTSHWKKEKRVLTSLVDGKACFALTLITNAPPVTILCSALLFASFVMLGPLASAQQFGHNTAHLTFDSTHGGGPYQCRHFNQNTDNCDLVEFSHDDIGGGTPDSHCYGAGSTACPPNGGAVDCAKGGNSNCEQGLPATLGSNPGEDSKNQMSDERSRGSRAHSGDGLVGNVERRQPPDLNREIYYRNKLEFSLEGGWHPINIPFPLDGLEGDPYHTYPLKYTLVPIFASLRWQMNGIGGPRILRGNWDLTVTGSVTAIPRGPETRYFSYIMGIRRNFVPRNSRIAPYFDMRFGLGNIDAKGGPGGVTYAQGQDFTFTVNTGSGVRYNFNPRYAITAGLNYMHISNANLSGQKTNYGINVFGPMVGIDIQLRRHQQNSEH